MSRESNDAAILRLQELALVQEAYPTFVPFLRDMMTELGFSTSDIQEEIGEYIATGPAYLMVQAQRGEAKTTITAIFAIFSLIHNPKTRVLIASAGATQASEISTLIVRLIDTVDILTPLRPDRSAGDRTSVDAFDVHYSLKGVDKSPSVSCVGITSTLQGKRADLLIADDVESQKNSLTGVTRQQLLDITRDFTSINSTGRIVYLGTPQSVESIYNTLPSRGFQVRVWPGRFPTKTQLDHYGDTLAPGILRRIEADPALMTGYGLDGEQGKAVDPLLLPEEQLLKKELDQGPAWFQLQHMLLTALTDALRFPLKTENLVSMRMGNGVYPMTVTRGFGRQSMKQWSVNGKTHWVNTPHAISPETAALTSSVLYIDPAGGGLNGDETAYAFGGLLNSNIYVVDWGGIPGGYDNAQMEALSALVVKHKPAVVKIEKNFGHGALRAVITPILAKACQKANIPMPGLVDDLVTGQKELRIIATLEPVLGRGALIINETILESEAASVQRYDMRVRETYSGLFQLAKLTRDRNSLIHDDRADALEGLVRHYAQALAIDQAKAIEASAKREYERMQKNPLSKPAYALGPPATSSFRTRVRTL